MKTFLIAILALGIATPAMAEPPEFTGPVARGQCPKGFIKKQGDCWRRIDDSGMGPAGFIDPEADQAEQDFYRWIDGELDRPARKVRR